MAVDNAVAVATIRDFVVFRERQKTILVRGRRLWRYVPEQLASIVDRAVCVPIESQEPVVRIGRCPRNVVAAAVVVDVKR